MASTMISRSVVVLSLLFSLFFSSYAKICKTRVFADNKNYVSCKDLAVLNSYIHWTYDQRTSTVDFAYHCAMVPPPAWISWAINPDQKEVIGSSQALVAYRNSTTGDIRVHTSHYKTRVRKGDLSFNVSQVSAEYDNVNNEIMMFAKVVLPPGTTVVNHIWRDSLMTEGRDGVHFLTGDNVRSAAATLNLDSGEVTEGEGGSESREDDLLGKKKVHGMLSMIGWGIMIPIGTMVARYSKPYKNKDDSPWFYFHILFQSLGAVLGLVAGGATTIFFFTSHGLQSNNPHSVIGICIYVLAAIQLLGLFLRPKDYGEAAEPSHNGKVWNVFHHCLGYLVVVLCVVNILTGLAMLKPGKAWKTSYLLTIGVLAGVSAIAEFVTHRRRRRTTGCCGEGGHDDD